MSKSINKFKPSYFRLREQQSNKWTLSKKCSRDSLSWGEQISFPWRFRITIILQTHTLKMQSGQESQELVKLSMMRKKKEIKQFFPVSDLNCNSRPTDFQAQAFKTPAITFSLCLKINLYHFNLFSPPFLFLNYPQYFYQILPPFHIECRLRKKILLQNKFHFSVFNAKFINCVMLFVFLLIEIWVGI